MRLPIPWRNGCSKKRNGSGQRKPVFTSHPVEDCSEEDVAPQRERIGLYENACDERVEEEDIDRAIENEDEDESPADEQPGYTRRDEALSGEADADVQVGNVQEDQVCDCPQEEPSEVPHELEHRPLHEPMVRGESALEDDRPHRDWRGEEPRHEVVRPSPKRRAWYLSEPISVERWQSTPHLRSGFSVA
ncbi:hypothetical protein CVIRNUC_003259 [Coccomyxa viridis]|uniref:Uncharacterized protein n=1 Tax=Coccomyxa viridis TaxID=1274662 RepID=A0AAV1HZ64_9CHLO|nr:hypothetical protein CVIRNUC_003259 [Coccomyxa viridis]